MGEHLTNLLDSYGPCIAEWMIGRETLIDWRENASNRGSGSTSGYWAERAQAGEQDADRLAQVLQAIDEHHHLSYVQWSQIRYELAEYKADRERRYGALPAGHTLAGNLTSGGIDL